MATIYDSIYMFNDIDNPNIDNPNKIINTNIDNYMIGGSGGSVNYNEYKLLDNEITLYKGDISVGFKTNIPKESDMLGGIGKIFRQKAFDYLANIYDEFIIFKEQSREYLDTSNLWEIEFDEHWVSHNYKDFIISIDFEIKYRTAYTCSYIKLKNISVQLKKLKGLREIREIKRTREDIFLAGLEEMIRILEKE